jgi:hypothetical protein
MEEHQAAKMRMDSTAAAPSAGEVAAADCGGRWHGVSRGVGGSFVGGASWPAALVEACRRKRRSKGIREGLVRSCLPRVG